MMIRNRIFSFRKAIFLAFLAISAAACGREEGVEEYRGNIGPHALDLTRKQKDEKSATPSPGHVWISLRPGNPLLVRGWSEECINKAEPAYAVTNKKRASFRIPFVPADKNHMDFSFTLKCISRGQTAGDEEKPLPVTILFNNKRIGVFYVKEEWDDFTFEIPADWFHMGSNYFIFVLHKKTDFKQSSGLAFKGFQATMPSLAMNFQADRIVRRTIFSGRAVSMKLPEPLPEGAELHFSLALMPALIPPDSHSVRYTLAACPESSGSSGEAIRFEYTLEFPRAEGEDVHDQKEQWCDGRMPLGQLAGEKVMLTLRAEAEPSGKDCLHAWGPMILTWDMPGKPRPLKKKTEFNLVMILVDALRADRVGTYGSKLGLTPRLDDLASRGIVFENTVSQGANTVTSVSSFLTGCYFNYIHEWVDKKSLPPSELLLTEALQSGGFRTIALVANPLLLPETGYSRGFDEYDQKVEWLPASELNKIFFSRLPLLEKTRFFAYLHYMDVHDPYGNPENRTAAEFETGRLKGTPLTGDIKSLLDEMREYLNTSIGETDRASMNTIYNEGIRYWDQHLVRFLAVMEERGLLEKTIVVVMADHGEEIFDHGLIGHGHTLYDELVHVPLMIWFPQKSGIDQPQRVKTAVQLLDVGPTILDFLGIPIPKNHRGKSLAPLFLHAKSEKEYRDGSTRFFETRQRCWRQPPFNDHLAGICKGPWKFILNRKNGEEKLYNLASDPGETKNLARERPRMTAEMRDLLHAWKKKETPPESDAKSLKPAHEVSEQVMNALQALGYVD